MTPEQFNANIVDYERRCPQLTPIFVETDKGRDFADIFRTEIVGRLYAKCVISTYLDNDDALNVRLVEDLQRRASMVSDNTFFYYDEGYLWLWQAFLHRQN